MRREIRFTQFLVLTIVLFVGIPVGHFIGTGRG